MSVFENMKQMISATANLVVTMPVTKKLVVTAVTTNLVVTAVTTNNYYDKAGCNSCYDEAGPIGILLRILCLGLSEGQVRTSEVRTGQVRTGQFRTVQVQGHLYNSFRDTITQNFLMSLNEL